MDMVLTDNDRKQCLSMLQGVLNQDLSAIPQLADRLTELGDAKLLEKILKRLAWVQMPHPAHFIGSRDCHYWLATWIPPGYGKQPEKTNGYLVSSVGEYWPYIENRDPDVELWAWSEISPGAFYETVVFHSMPTKRTDRMCCPYTAATNNELDVKRYKTSTDAAIGHWEMCEKWAGLL